MRLAVLAVLIFMAGMWPGLAKYRAEQHHRALKPLSATADLTTEPVGLVEAPEQAATFRPGQLLGAAY